MLIVLKLATLTQNLISPYVVNFLFSAAVYFGVNVINWFENQLFSLKLLIPCFTYIKSTISSTKFCELTTLKMNSFTLLLFVSNVTRITY